MIVNFIDRFWKTFANLKSFINNDFALKWKNIAQNMITIRIFLIFTVHSKNEITEMFIEKIENTTMKEFLENFLNEKIKHLILSMIYLIIEWNKSRKISYDTNKKEQRQKMNFRSPKRKIQFVLFSSSERNITKWYFSRSC